MILRSMFLFDLMLVSTIFLVGAAVFYITRQTMKDMDNEKRNRRKSDRILDSFNEGEHWKN